MVLMSLDIYKIILVLTKMVRKNLYNIALRPFLTRIFFQELFGLEGQKKSCEKNPFLTRNFFRKICSPKICSGKKS